MEKQSTFRALIDQLNLNGIRYCHWKSNVALAQSIAGRADVDLLVHRGDADGFRNILNRLHFRPAVMTAGKPFPSVEHYFALDEETGTLVHVHAYFRAITGESLTKNYRFPIEEMLLGNTREVYSVRVPTRSAELIVFTLRMMLKHTSLAELLLLARYWKQVGEEMDWLLETDPVAETLGLVRCYLPTLDPNLFSACIEALKEPAPLYRRILLAHRLRAQLKLYARHSTLKARLEGVRKFATMFFRRFARSQKSLAPSSGGAMIAFVGSEATGKSTLISEMRAWLGEHFAVQQIHVGKPNATPLTWLPNILLPALRAFFPKARTTQVDVQQDAPDRTGRPRKYPLLFVIRAALLAHDRWSLLARAFREAANGTIILCDRYPSEQCGAPDSPQLSGLAMHAKDPSIRSWLARIEARYYHEMPSPDLVIYLTAPLEVTIARNAARSKFEAEAYVRRRHARSSNLEFQAAVYRVDTDQPLERTILEVKQAIWAVL